MADLGAQNGEEVTRAGGQVQVHFVTEEKEFELEESKRVLLVPTGTISHHMVLFENNVNPLLQISVVTISLKSSTPPLCSTSPPQRHSISS